MEELLSSTQQLQLQTGHVMWLIGCMEMKYAHAKVQNYNYLALLIMQLSGILVTIVVIVA